MAGLEKKRGLAPEETLSESGGDPQERKEGEGGETGPRSPRRTRGEQTERLAALLRAVEGAERVVILTHDNPDPDSIACVAALAFLLDRAAGLSSTFAVGGIIGRAENRALIDELDLTFQRVETVQFASDALVALVDTQPRAGNNSLPGGRIATLVIDHHPLRPESSSATFADVRPEYGACCSILVEYLRAAKLEPDRRLASALFYGIQTETMDLGREVSEADVGASLYLYPRSDPAAISRIRHARVPPGFFQSLHSALERAWRADGVICVPAGRLDYPDMVAQLADFFMRVEGVVWVIASGLYHDDLLLSLRTLQPEAHAGELVREVVGGRGSAGGHGTMAGARISIRNLGEGEVEELLQSLFSELCAALGVTGREPESIIPPEPPSPAAGEGDDEA
ncbi:MAG: bifunctional oligoribonuclease/PAP phosphatase NrnA [Gemmatimonadota bacterium]